ncbi:type II toxin-antitoxin system RelE/ParE family toxin [Aminipila luticellarii]|uniref:Plasmid maintenance system killer protein n=1 Tax=Aminipila luticellarii TaxID=2507160 RepID=A0A410PSN2_9FIRM|nr:plasmid maintenance system killer protein [Aminipila luticellarii]QAT41972.1 plasmid maintenance system killer protein [Aminipila luticellarii]
MEIHYSSAKQEKILTDVRLLKKYYGTAHIKLRNRLSELRFANNLSDISELPPPRRHKLNGQYRDCWGIDYSKNYRIILQPIGEYDISDIATISEVLIIALEDYH